MGLLHEKLTYKLRGCFFEVHNQLGLGWDEESYHLALEQELTRNSISFESKVPCWLSHQGIATHKFIADLVVEEQIILELKSFRFDFHPSNYAQIIAYLKCWNKQIGFLVNFGLSRVAIKRMIFTEDIPSIIEDYSGINHLIKNDDSWIIEEIRMSIITICNIHGVGYTDNIYYKLFTVELSHRGIAYNNCLEMPLIYKGEFIRTFELKMFLIQSRILCGIVATRDKLKNDILSFKTYLRNLDIPFGILAHFGKGRLEILGIAKD